MLYDFNLHFFVRFHAQQVFLQLGPLGGQFRLQIPFVTLRPGKIFDHGQQNGAVLFGGQHLIPEPGQALGHILGCEGNHDGFPARLLADARFHVGNDQIHIQKPQDLLHHLGIGLGKIGSAQQRLRDAHRVGIAEFKRLPPIGQPGGLLRCLNDHGLRVSGGGQGAGQHAVLRHVVQKGLRFLPERLGQGVLIPGGQCPGAGQCQAKAYQQRQQLFHDYASSFDKTAHFFK